MSSTTATGAQCVKVPVATNPHVSVSHVNNKREQTTPEADAADISVCAQNPTPRVRSSHISVVYWKLDNVVSFTSCDTLSSTTKEMTDI